MKKRFDEVIFDRFEANIETGLSSAQVALRTKQKLTNHTKQKASKSVIRIFFDNIFTYFNLIYAFILTAFLFIKSYDNLLFIVVVAANTLIAVVQEIKAKITVEKLKLVSTPKVKVLRNGKLTSVFANRLVLDDIIKLSVGNQIPSDSVVIEGRIDVNESLLTGESRSVKKKDGDRLLAGSFLTAGECWARVDKVGKQNYIQTIASQAKQFKSPSSNLFKDLKTIIRYIGIMIIPVGALLFINNYFGTGANNIADAINRTGAALIGMIPAGMFLLITIALSVGVVKLAGKKTLVKDLYSIENLARVNVLCLDKTGTITDGTMQVNEVLMLKKVSYNFNHLFSNFLASQKASNATSYALTQHFGQSYDLKITETIPFSSDRKFSAASFEKHGTVVLGAPDFLGIKLDKALKQKISRRTNKGDRVLMIATSSKPIKNDSLPALEPVALVVLEDHIRPDAKETIEWFRKNDVDIKIISGDDAATVSSIAKRVGVENANKTISLEGMSLSDVAKIANKFTVFGRVSPEQKHALIKALKNAGNVVAMTGDGVNDTLALKEADCSISMVDGSEVARGISHLVLLNSKFSSLPEVVKEGRKVVNNIQQSSALYLMKTFFTIVLSLITLITFSPYPFLPMQAYLLELFIIGLPSVILALQKNEKRIKGNFIKAVLKNSVPHGAVLLVNILLMMLLTTIYPVEAEAKITLGTLLLTSIGFVNLVKICWPLNKIRLGTLLLSLVLILASITIPPIHKFFGISVFTLETTIIYLSLLGITSIGMYFIPIISGKIMKKLKIKPLLEEE